MLNTVPLATDRFDDALPLLPNVVRGPDGLLNMNGARADQSAFLLNGVSMTDPVSGHFAVRLPIEAIETLNVQAGASPASVGGATAGVTDVITRSGQDAVSVQVQNFLPRPRFADGGIRGVDSFTPRFRVSGPIEPGRVWFSEAASYRFVRSRVDELQPLDRSEQKVSSFDSITQIDALINPSNHATATFVVYPSNIDNAGISTLRPYEATPDLKQRGWLTTLAENVVLNSNTTLATSFAAKQYNTDVAPKYGDAALITVSGARDNYFNRISRDARRYDASSTLSIMLPQSWGAHLLRVGAQFAHTRYDGVDASQPVLIARADGSTARQITYVGAPSTGASNNEAAAFIDNQWMVGTRLTIHGGTRLGYEQIAGEYTVAPRVDASVRPFENGRTILKASVGRAYDRLPLNAADYSTQQSRLVTDYDEGGRVTSTALLVNRVAADGLRTPSTTSWNVEVDQLLAQRLTARAGYRQSRGSNQLVVDQQGTDVLQLSSTGRTASHEFEAVIRREFNAGSHVTGAYVRSSTKGDLNDFVSIFGELRAPVIQRNEYGRQPFDTPNRFLLWGSVMLPRDIAVTPTMEYRTGFPYSVVDERQNVVGLRNDGGRFPNLFTLDLAVTKDVRLPKLRRARIGVQVFNLTNHFNPQDVQNNLASPAYGEFANSVDRQIRTKFTLLF